MKEQAKTPVFQEDNGTWAHLTKLVNPLICTIVQTEKGAGYAFYLFGISGLLAE